jgi:Peptidase inhibitor family I36
MKKTYWAAIAILITASLVVSSLSCSNSGGPTGVTLYRDVNYSGVEQDFMVSSPDLDQTSIGNDTVSSIRVPGGYTATLYRDPNYQGFSETFTDDDPDLSDNPIGNDTASSLMFTIIGD